MLESEQSVYFCDKYIVTWRACTISRLRELVCNKAFQAKDTGSNHIYLHKIVSFDSFIYYIIFSEHDTLVAIYYLRLFDI